MESILYYQYLCRKCTFCFLSIFLAAVFNGPTAKVRADKAALVNQSEKRSSSDNITTIENRLRPFLENRINRRISPRYFPEPASDYEKIVESDFFALPRIWNNLSTEFKQLYQKASQIPLHFNMYESPEGFFEIYYTTDTNYTDHVDSTDRYGYSSINRKIKNESPNGIPDYIDEIAWALDSTYIAEIIEFGFIQPVPYKDNNHPSNKYKVIVEHLRGGGDYGLTYVFPEQRGSDGGFASYFTIRNSWPSDEWSHLGYDKNPHLGIRVTCAHEFFHAVQYAMTTNLDKGVIYLDDFPLSWIEGTAVSMEELVFGDINDYIQYANIFFYYPGKSFLARSAMYSSSFDYSNSLLALYLFYQTMQSPTIDFTYRVFHNNYNNPLPFYTNLEQTSLNLGYNWVDLLNNFHTASFFSGLRADSLKFIPDAKLFEQWSYSYSNTSDITKTVNPYAMEKVFIKSEPFQSDTLIIHFNGNQKSGNTGKQWAVSVIFRTESSDSIITVPISSQGKGLLMLPQWSKGLEAGIIVTNGNPEQENEFNVSLEYGNITLFSGEKTVLEKASSDSQSYANVYIEALSDLRCSLSVSSEIQNFLIDSAASQSLSPYTSLFTIDYPEFWNEKSDLKLSIGTISENMVSIPDSIGLYYWNETLSQWEILESDFVIRNNTLSVSPIKISKPGVYGIFLKGNVSTSRNIVVYPNPFSLQKDRNSIIFDGTGIKDIVIYDVNGNLVKTISSDTRTNSISGTVNTKLRWDLKNRSNNTVIPGLYIVTVSYHDVYKNETKTVRRKLLVTP